MKENLYKLHKNDLGLLEYVQMFERSGTWPGVKLLISGLESDNMIRLEVKMQCLSYVMGYSYGDAKYWVYHSVLKSFFAEVSEWSNLKHFVECGYNILDLLTEKNSHLYTKNLSSKIRKFVNSYLNAVKKEEMSEELIVQVLINQGMFEELIHYNFVSDFAINELWKYVFEDFSFETMQKPLFIDFWRPSSKREAFQRKVMLLSWDKVKDRHALSALHTLIAKRGDLVRFLGVELERTNSVPYSGPLSGW